MTPVGNATRATFAQHAIWFTEEAGVGGTAYHMPVGIWFTGAVDRCAIGEACAAVVARHEILSTAVDARGGEVNLVPAARKISVHYGDLTPGAVADEIRRPFDLRDGPLARIVLLQESPRRHLLLLTAHHLVFDGMSKDTLVADLAAGYNAAVAGQPVDLGPAPPSYAEHEAAERARVEADLSAAREFWRSRWSGPGDVVLPDLVRVPAAAEPGATVTFALDAELVRGLDGRRTELGLTRFEALLAALHLLLRRYGNPAQALAVGLSTRTAAATDQIGLFVNELPVGVDPQAHTFRELAERVRAELRAIYRFRAVPLAHTVGGLRPAPALTPVSFGYRRRGPEPSFAGVDTAVEWMMFNGAARNALHIQVVDAPDGVTVSLQYAPAAIDTAAVHRIGAHLRTLLASVVTDPDQRRPEILPAVERDDVVRRWNRTERTVPPADTVVSLFAAQARQRPDAVAVVDGERRLSYSDLDADTSRLAAALRRRGAGPGGLVAVSLGRSYDAIVALLGVLRAGAAYVPIDPTYPAARRALILADAQPDLVLDGLGSLDDGDAGVLEPPGPEGRAYVMYTSGSTGQPKGVAVSHRALVNLLTGMADLVGASPEHRWLNLTSLSFDISGLELFAPLTTGGRVVVAPSALDGGGVLRLARAQAVTHVQATPSGWRVLLDAGLGEGGPEPVTALCGGEALPLGLARDLRQRVDRLFNVYGPTETTIWSTAAEIPAGPDEVTLGRPIANTQAYVLDGDLEPVPVGVPGELYLGGAGVALGYLRRPDLTGERFRPDPFTPDGRLYRTGDVCRRRADGQLDYLGRTDNQVKVRGHRVELDEIEERLRVHPEIGQAAVALRDDVLVGYVVARRGPLEPAALRRNLADALPAAMVPSAWVFLDRLPLTPNGKLDRAALPPPLDHEPAPAPALGERAPSGSDPLLQQMREIWQDVLQIAGIGLDEDLFDLGGHSLTITRISSRIRQRFGVDVPLDAFFDTPTIAEISAVVVRLGGAGAGGAS
jgi:amino acid adenylation domain-containing protein